jgi:site-specific DNA-methyltransferase (adenine-specific)
VAAGYEDFPDASVDLVYLDPPFNSNADYNVLFHEASGEAKPEKQQEKL